MRDTGEIGYTYGRRGRGLFWRAVESVLAFILEHTLSHVAGGRGGEADVVVAFLLENKMWRVGIQIATAAAAAILVLAAPAWGIELFMCCVSGRIKGKQVCIYRSSTRNKKIKF